jgi:ankyrin repeat protein
MTASTRTAGDKSGQTPLLWAADNGHELVVKLLLAKDSIDPNSKKALYGRTLLSWAAETGHEAVVRLLLATKANVKFEDSNGRTPLNLAAKNGYNKVMKLLLENNAVGGLLSN